MAKPRAKKPVYKDYVTAVSKVVRAKKLADFPKLTVVFGSSEFLLNKFCINVKEKWEALGGSNCSRSEAVGLDRDQFSSMWEQESLFEPTAFYMIGRVEKRADFWNLLSGIPENKIKNHLCIAISSEKINPKLKRELDRLDAHFVPCIAPKQYEMAPIVSAIANKAGMKLDQNAVDLILEAVGGDLARLQNEINKLALIFAESKEAIGKNDVAPHLGMLREDHTFQLTDFLIQNKGAAAHALAVDLLKRGEKIEKIVGFLALHCRDSIKISESAGGPSAGIAPWKIKKYSRYVSRAPKGLFHRTLECCREVDLALKTSPISKELLLARIIDSLIYP